ncbi:MAG TPA: TadE/TadG family type IV pilus assembly protein [Gemmataceae bacterium]|jgi:Flp pilus assembly protein TadG|nr:TadE/TadG family type IV pilus assembly protein [Gemmataceae bacterium]
MRVSVHSEIHDSGRAQRRAGAAAVETAIVIGVCLLFMFAILQYAHYVMIRQVVENAAREGARQAVVKTSSATTADIQAVVQQYLSGQNLSNLSIQVYEADPATGANIGPWTSTQWGQGIAVEVSGTYKSILPSFGFLPNTVNVHVKSIMRSEAN